MDTSHLATGVAPCGTFAYAAPELLMGTRCDEKVRLQRLPAWPHVSVVTSVS